MANLKTLKSWKKGQSGNPKGRPKKLPKIDELLAEVLGDENEDDINAAKAILMKWRQLAVKGDLKAGEMLMNRGYGKPKEHIDHTTKDESLNIPIIEFVKSKDK